MGLAAQPVQTGAAWMRIGGQVEIVAAGASQTVEEKTSGGDVHRLRLRQARQEGLGEPRLMVPEQMDPAGQGKGIVIGAHGKGTEQGAEQEWVATHRRKVIYLTSTCQCRRCGGTPHVSEHSKGTYSIRPTSSRRTFRTKGCP